MTVAGHLGMLRSDYRRASRPERRVDLTQRPRPLDGLRVLDLSRAFGKVTRGRSGLYSHVNAGKRSILLDLHRPGDVARLLDLAAVCDVLVENFRPGVLDRFGAGWAALSAVNPLRHEFSCPAPGVPSAAHAAGV
jgi:CoA-transferase family III